MCNPVHSSHPFPSSVVEHWPWNPTSQQQHGCSIAAHNPQHVQIQLRELILCCILQCPYHQLLYKYQEIHNTGASGSQYISNWWYPQLHVDGQHSQQGEPCRQSAPLLQKPSIKPMDPKCFGNLKMSCHLLLDAIVKKETGNSHLYGARSSFLPSAVHCLPSGSINGLYSEVAQCEAKERGWLPITASLAPMHLQELFKASGNPVIAILCQNDLLCSIHNHINCSKPINLQPLMSTPWFW